MGVVRVQLAEYSGQLFQRFETMKVWAFNGI